MADSTAFGLGPIGQIAVPVQNLDRAVQFYTHTLGMQHLFSAGSLAFFNAGGVRLLLSVPESPDDDHRASVLYFKVADLDAAYHTLRERGVAFDDAPHLIAQLGDHDLWMAFFRDSEHNLLALMAELPPA